MATINSFFLPTLESPEYFAGKNVVVIDVLRATTTLTHALASGARDVRPCRDVDEARQLSEQHTSALLCGERHEQRVEGFDLGNSPGDYTPDVVAQRSLIFTTTNGTAAIDHCRSASRLFLAAFVNLSAICRAIEEFETVEIVCAGTRGEITLEDVLLAGAIVAQLMNARGTRQIEQNDQSQIASGLWESASHPLTEWLERSQGGRNLIKSGFRPDIQFAADVDRFDVVPEFDAASNLISSTVELI